LARCCVPTRRIVVHAAVAHVHAVHHGVAKWPATLDYSPAHGLNVGSWDASSTRSDAATLTRPAMLLWGLRR
jgi:hypothetical protein